MKVGIITQYYNSKNIGGLLQSYALVAFLRSIGFDSEQICYDFSVSNEEINRYKAKRKRILFLTSGYKIIISKIKNRINKNSHANTSIKNYIEKQNAIFEEFEHFIPHSDEVYDVNTISEANSEYDVFITGSDQVWNVGQLLHRALFLSFTEKKRIAYAVSMGKASITKFEESYFLQNIRGFQDIAVREESLGKFITSISDKKCTTVLDPTLLLDYDKWKAVENTSIVPTDRYIFCYFLGDCDWQRIVVQSYAEKYDLRIIDIPFITKTIRPSDRLLKSEKHYDIGPREFIALIKNAECVFTDSFHAMAFSINFETDFYVFDRDGLSGGKSMNSRIVDFLSIFSLENRRIESSGQAVSNVHISWDDVTPVLNQKRDASIVWLNEHLNE